MNYIDAVEDWHEKVEAAEPAYVDERIDHPTGGFIGDSVVIGPVDLVSPDMARTRAELDDVHRDRITGEIYKGRKHVKATKADAIEMRIRALKKELKRLKSRPEEPAEDGNVITFQKQFAAGGIVYSYAALKAKDLWYTTGPKSPKGYTWDELMDFIGDDNRIYLVTEATPLIGG